MELLQLGCQLLQLANRPEVGVDTRQGLLDPLFNPLLLLPDFWKVIPEKESNGDVIRLFHGSAAPFLRQLITDLTNTDESHRARAAYVLRELDVFVHHWIAYVPLTITLDRPFLVKITQLLPLTNQRGFGEVLERLRRYAFYLPLIKRVEGLREFCYSKAWAQPYTLSVGDAQSTHIEIATPNASEFVIDHARSFVEVNRRRFPPEVVFGTVSSYEEHGVIHFYTARTVTEFFEGLRALGAAYDPRAKRPELWITYNLELGLRFAYRTAVLLSALTAALSMLSAYIAFRDHTAPSSFVAYVSIVASILGGLLLFRPLDRRVRSRIGWYKLALLLTLVFVWAGLALQALGVSTGWLP